MLPQLAMIWFNKCTQRPTPGGTWSIAARVSWGRPPRRTTSTTGYAVARSLASRFGRLVLITGGLLTWTALPLIAHAQGPAFLVKDINTAESGYPTCLTSFDGKVFFTVDDLHAGPGLWRSDGTPEGTVRIKAGSHGCPTATDDALFWVVGSELWKSDGTVAGTVPLLALEPGFVLLEPTAVNRTLFFVAVKGNDLDTVLWRTDGTVAGTVPLIRFPALLFRPELPASKLTAANGTLFFSADDGNGFGLWKSDGTAAGTVRLTNFRLRSSFNFGPEQLSDVNGTLFFTHPWAGGLGFQELWRSDGTVNGTERIAVYGNVDELTDVNGTLFFVSGGALWRSDGTAAGTMRFADIHGWGLTNAAGTLYFVASSDDGTALWRSDGTEAGTRMVRQVAIEDIPVSVSGQLYFRAGDASAGSELWRSDGTETGTVRVKDIRPGPAGSMPFYSFGYGTEVSGTLFFVADDGNTGQEIWKTDGTEAGTARVADLLHDNSGSSPNHLTDVNGLLLFRAYDGSHGSELWRSDGTNAGTQLVKDINPGEASSQGGLPGSLKRVHGTVFAADDGSSGDELWHSDGTESGTVRVKDINPGPMGSLPFHLTEAGGTLFFWADDGSHGFELWKSDGTPGGTVLVRDIDPGSDGSATAVFFRCGSQTTCPEPTDVNGTLFFGADDGSTGLELWKTDGTAEGTMRVADIVEGAEGSYPAELTGVNGTLFFTVRSELWRSDGTAAGTMRVADIEASQLTDVNGTLFFLSGGGLWRSNGTAADTVPLREVGPDLAGISDLTNFAGTLVFIGVDASGVWQLWRSDGTQAGTVPVKQLPQGLPLSPLTDVIGMLLFAVGGEVWQSDGTEAGTGPIQDLGPGAALPSWFTRAGGRIFFSADGGGTGDELWALTLATSCRGDCSADGRVTISDLITAVNIALGRVPLSACESLDADDGGTITVGEIVAAVNEVLHGCA